LIGAGGTTTTALRPEGEVDVEGRRLPARADKGYLDNDIPIIVVGVDGPRVLVAAAAADRSAENEGTG
jgi:membrane-bound ClpP family serine protease